MKSPSRASSPGEHWVASSPTPSLGFVAAGFTIAVEREASAEAEVHGRRIRRRGAQVVERAPAARRCRGGRPRRQADRRRGRGARAGYGADRLPRPTHRRSGNRAPAARGVVAFAMESIPRITRAQSMDALLAEHRRGLQGGRAGGRPAAAPLPADDDRRGDDRPGQGARARRRRRGAAGDRDDVGSARSSPASTSGWSCASRSRAWERPSSTSASSPRRQAAATSSWTPEEQKQQQAALEERIPEFDVVITTALVPRPPGAAPDPDDGGRADARRRGDRRPAAERRNC